MITQRKPPFSYKAEVAKRGKKLKDLAIEFSGGKTFHKEYSRISRMINGFTTMPPDVESRIVEILKKWDFEQNHTKM